MTGPTPKLRIVHASASEPPEVSDDELMAQERRGVPGAFDALVLRHQARMLRVAVRLTRDPAAAADAVQDAFVELFCARKRYQASGKLKSYLYRLLLNRCRRKWRRERSALRFLNLVTSQPEPPGHLDGLNVDVERSLARLNDQQRSAILLHYAGGLTQQEIADALEIPIGTVKSRIFEGVSRIKEMMEAP